MTHEKHCSTQLSSNIPLPCDCSKRTIVSLDDVVFSPVEQSPTPTAERDKRIAELEQRHVQFMVTGGPVVMATEYERVNAQLAERDATIATLEQWKREAMESMGAWDEVIKYLSGDGFDVKDWSGTWQKACLRRLKLLAERDAELLKLRDALKGCRSHWGGYCITKQEQFESVMKDFWEHIRRCDVVIDDALSSTSAAAERIGARYLRELLEHIMEWELGSGGQIVGWIRERASALERADTEGGNG